MREDMAKVIVERPRKRGCALNKPKSYAKQLYRIAAEDQPKRESIKRRWWAGEKYLNEHLGPLRRFLDSRLGRPWDAVFSEICERINRHSAVQDHVRDHVEQYVVKH